MEQKSIIHSVRNNNKKPNLQKFVVILCMNTIFATSMLTPPVKFALRKEQKEYFTTAQSLANVGLAEVMHIETPYMRQLKKMHSILPLIEDLPKSRFNVRKLVKKGSGNYFADIEFLTQEKKVLSKTKMSSGENVLVDLGDGSGSRMVVLSGVSKESEVTLKIIYMRK